jgi:hypothetical protein
MEYQEENYNTFNNEQKQDTNIALYSSFSIVMFSIFFSSLFGAYLLRSNLIAVGNKEAANRLSIFAVVYFIATIVIAMIPNPPVPILSMVMNWIGGNLLAYYFQKQLIPEHVLHPKKPILKVLIASLLISLVLVSLLVLMMANK